MSVVAAIGCAAWAKPGDGLLQMRLRADDTRSDEVWRANLTAFASHPGCCDEVWFSTCMGTPSLEWHRTNVAVIARAAADLRRLGIEPSLQFQATIGHGDQFGRREPFASRQWTGWTGSKGYETTSCNCPRQPAFLAYLSAVSHLYAPISFKALWIDDDLRFNNHLPADNKGKRVGCWCATCLGAFNRENGTSWTRETLAAAVETDEALAARWRAFSIASLCGVARTIAAAFHADSPQTMMAQQQGNWPDAVDSVRALLTTLHEVSGGPVGYRPGAGAYWDRDPMAQVKKSLATGRFRELLGNPDFVCEWTHEVESAPRTYYSRSAQSVLIEGFTTLMYGMDHISYFISNSSKESPALYAEHFWAPLADAAPVLHGYARAIKGCLPVGICGTEPTELRRAGLPILSGAFGSRGKLTADELALNPESMTSGEVQKLRETLDARCGHLPVLLTSPFYGMMQIHVDSQGNLRTVALVNLRIDAQRNVRLALRNLPPAARTATWHELCRPARTLPLQRRNREALVIIPALAPWSAGYLDLN